MPPVSVHPGFPPGWQQPGVSISDAPLRRTRSFAQSSRHPADNASKDEGPEKYEGPRGLCTPEKKAHLHHVSILDDERCKNHSDQKEYNPFRSHSATFLSKLE